MKTSVLPVVAAVLACLLAPPASAAPAEDAAVAASTTSAPPSGPAGPIGPIGQALDTFVREAPERVKTLQDNFRKNAGAIRERVRGGLSRVIGTAGVETTTKAHHHSEAPSTTAITATTTAAPPVDPTASKPPTGSDTAAPTTPGNVPDITTTQKPESRTLIGAPKRCGPNMKADRNGRCREVYQDADEEA